MRWWGGGDRGSRLAGTPKSNTGPAKDGERTQLRREREGGIKFVSSLSKNAQKLCLALRVI